MLMAVLESPTCAGRHKCIILAIQQSSGVLSTKCRKLCLLSFVNCKISYLPTKKKKKKKGQTSMYISMNLYSHGVLF